MRLLGLIGILVAIVAAIFGIHRWWEVRKARRALAARDGFRFGGSSAGHEDPERRHDVGRKDGPDAAS